ncbi:MAG: hypothetical protein ISS55_02765 [Dehalococcoidales bacterium]|nr:hypothetical protein [Dehalococcoidales bacterium]
MSERIVTPFSGRWDVRTGSPRKLWRSLHDFLEDSGFAHEYHELLLAESPIEGTATFSDWLVGHKDRQRLSSFWFLRILVGTLLCVTILLIPLGMPLIRSRTRMVRTWARISVEGEVYRTRGADMRSSHASEVLDVAADARITLDILAGEPDKNSSYEITKPTEDRGEIKAVRHEFEELQYRVDQLLPGETLPSTELREV